MLHHLIELRRRTLRILLCFSAFFIVFYIFSSDIFSWLVTPLLHALSPKTQLISTQITGPIFIPLKLALNLALLATTPLVLQQIWGFAAPGLYSKERTYGRAALIFSVLLFVMGVLFCFYLVLPFLFQIITKALPQGVQFLPDMSSTLDFIFHMLILFGISFQIPLIVLTLSVMNIISCQQLQQIRPYIIVAAFVLGMLLTPPDVLSQIILAIPLWLLFESGIWLSKMLTAKPDHSPIQGDSGHENNK